MQKDSKVVKYPQEEVSILKNHFKKMKYPKIIKNN
jgi:hypothetical protein